MSSLSLYDLNNNKATKDVATPSADGLMSLQDKAKLDNIAAGANNYVHPTSHAATMITEDTLHRFVTDTEKSTWNAKEPAISKNTGFNLSLETVVTNIKMNGTQSLGSLNTLARADHIHPIDTSRAASTHDHGNILSNGKVGFTGNLVLTTGTDGTVTAKTAGTTSQYLRGDGIWATPPNTIYTLPVASTTLGGVKSGTNITVDASGNVTVNNSDTVDGLHGTQFIRNDIAQNLINASGIKGTGTGTANMSYFEFNESNGTTSQGFIGFGSSVNDTLTLKNYITNANLDLVTSGTGIVTINGNKVQTLQTRTATITTTWNETTAPYTQTITVSGLTSSSIPNISPVYSTDNATAILQKAAWNMVGKIVTGTNIITVTCFEEKPTTAIPIQIMGG